MADIKKIKVGNTTYDIRDATAARSNHTHSFDTITNRGEAFLSWGGKNFSGSYGPIDAAMVPELGANRLAFMPANAVTIEYSRDGGSTWTDYGPTDPQKIDLFNGRGSSFTIGKATSGEGNIATNQYQLRVNIYTDTGRVYTALNKFVIYLSTSGTNNNWCTIRARKQSDYTAGNDTWTTFADKISVSGWSGYNVINTSGITTYGNTASTQYGHIQFIFGCDTGSTNNSYPGLQINKIFGFGGVGWTTPSTMAKTGHMYTYDSSQNVTFPAGVSAKSFTEGGTSLSNKYLGKTAKAADADKLDGNDSAYYLNYNNLSNKPTIPTVPTALKNPNSITFKAGSDTVLSYDGSAAKTFTVAASTTAGAFTISDGTTTRTIQLAGKFTDADTHNSHAIISGTKSDGSTQIKGSASSGDITLGDSGVTAGAYGDTSDQTPGYNATFKVPSISVNAKGIVTAIGEHTVKIPASDNTDTKNTAGATNDASKLYLVGAKNQNESDKTYSNSNVYMTNGTLAANTLKTEIIDTKNRVLDIRTALSNANYNIATFKSYTNGETEGVLNGHLIVCGKDDSSNLLKPADKTGINMLDTYYFNTGITLDAGGDAADQCKLSFPGKSGTFLLDSDLVALTLTDNSTKRYLIGSASSTSWSDIGTNGKVYTQSGYIYADAFYAASDRRLKENIKDLDLNCLDLVNNINLREFSWKTDETHKPVIGAIAQELRQVLPEKYVHEFIGGQETDDEYLSINDSKLVYLLIGAIQEQQKEIESLKAKIDSKIV